MELDNSDPARPGDSKGRVRCATADMELDRRRLLQIMAAAGLVADTAAAAQVKWSGGSELPRLRAPPNACDCHHFIYDSRYPADRRGIPFPGDALVEDYRALQRRLGIARHVVIQPSTYGADNLLTLDAAEPLGHEARAALVVYAS